MTELFAPCLVCTLSPGRQLKKSLKVILHFMALKVSDDVKVQCKLVKKKHQNKTRGCTTTLVLLIQMKGLKEM